MVQGGLYSNVREQFPVDFETNIIFVVVSTVFYPDFMTVMFYIHSSYPLIFMLIPLLFAVKR